MANNPKSGLGRFSDQKESGFFDDRGSTLLLHRDSAGTTISFTLAGNVWVDDKVIDAFSSLVRSVAGPPGGFPTQLRLVHTTGKLKKELTVL